MAQIAQQDNLVMFQFYLSSIKRLLLGIDKGLPIEFQFYLSSIKSN